MKTVFQILAFNLFHILVITPLLVFLMLIEVAVLKRLADSLWPSALWIQFALFCFLIGWLARCCQLRVPFLLATILSFWVFDAVGLIIEPLFFAGVFLTFSWAGFFVPFPARTKGLWEISMPWISKYPLVTIPLGLAFLLGSFRVLDDIDLGYGRGQADGRLISAARELYFDAHTHAIENDKPYLRIDNQDISDFVGISGAVYVRKGEIHLQDLASDTLLLVFDENRLIQSGGNLYSRRCRPMHTGLTVTGKVLRFSVAEFEALDLSDFVYLNFETEVGMVRVDLNPRKSFPEQIAYFQTQLDLQLDQPASLVLEPAEIVDRPAPAFPTTGGYLRDVSLRDALSLITELEAAEVEYNGKKRTILLRKNTAWGTRHPSPPPPEDPFAPFMDE